MTTPVWSVPNNTNLGLITEISPYELVLPLNVSGLTTTVISGQLPPGLYLDNNSIVGTPLEVHTETVFSFVIRARSETIISDRALSLRVSKLEIWNIDDNEVLGTIDSKNPVSFVLPISNPSSTTTTLLTPLPQGLTLVNNTIVGVALEVDHNTNFSVVIKATNNDISADRNLIIKLKNLIWKVPNNYNINTIPEEHAYSLDLFPTLLSNSTFSTSIIDGNLPSGLTLSNNVISGTTNPVAGIETSTFTIRASHISGAISDRTFTLTVAISPWNILTGYDINKNHTSNLPISERDDLTFNIPVDLLVNPDDTVTEVISGMLPPGLVLIDNVLQGKPFEVADTTTFTFVIRAVLKGVTSDRTFYLTVEGADVPIWITDPGNLPIGESQRYYVRDESYVDFQLIAIDTDEAAGQTLSFWIASEDGQLPPGLTLSNTGRLSGWVEPILTQPNPSASGYYDSTPYDSAVYDRGTINSYGFDSYGYDVVNYDFNEFFARPRKLNRNYEFTVSISDGNTVVKRTFSIFVVGDSALLTDSTLIGSDFIDLTTDLSSIRAPVWKTASDLGFRRANNYQTIKLDIYETIDNLPVVYSLNDLNPDNTPSLLPPGLEFDSNTSEIFGVVPYQPAVTKDYKFTITAIRIGPLKEDPTSSEEQYPIKINDDIVYRNFSVETDTGYNRVYETTGYNTSLGVRLYRETSTSSWIYQNNNFDFIHYSLPNIQFVWDTEVWFSDILLSTVTLSPMIIVLPTGPTVYTDYYESSSSPRTFTIRIIGEIDRNIQWISPQELGILEAEQICTLRVEARCSDDALVNYSLISGSLPPGLTLNSDGEIIGEVTQFNSYRYIGNVIGGEQHNPTDLRGPKRYARVTGRVNDGVNEWDNGTYIWNTNGTLSPIIYVSSPSVIGSNDMMNPSEMDPLNFLPDTYHLVEGDGWFYYNENNVTFPSTPPYQNIVFSSPIVPANSTMLVPSEEYTAIITVDGVDKTISELGSNMDTFTNLLTVINTALGASATAIFDGSNIKITSSTYGIRSSVSIDPGTLFSAPLDTFSSLGTPGILTSDEFDYFTSHTFYLSTNEALYWSNGPHKVSFVEVIGTIDPFLEALDISNKPGKLPGDFHIVTTAGWFFDGINLFYANTDYSIVLNALDQAHKIKTSDIESRLTVFDFTLDQGNTTIDRVFGFDVMASDNVQSKQIIQTFYIKVVTPNTQKFSDLVVRPLMLIQKREEFKNFITNMEIFDSKLLYRAGDPNFGIQDTLTMLIYAGIETTQISEVIAAVGLNHERKHFKFGEIKTAQAKIPGTHTVIYEVVYIEMLDPLQIGKVSLPLSIETAPENNPLSIDNNQITLNSNNLQIVDPYQTLKLPSTITNWRKRINDIGLHDRHYLPLWMRTIQDGSMVELDYVPAVTLCYCLPGQSSTILLNIKNYIKTTGFNFNQFDYDIDRYIISEVTEDPNNKYIMFPIIS